MPIVTLLFHDIYVSDPRESGFASRGADRYKLALPRFEAQLGGIVRAGARVIAADGLAADPADRFNCVLTVDDGGGSYYRLAADRLEANGWRGACFITTDRIGQPGFMTASELRELDARGHVIGTHSASHPATFSACRRPQMYDEWSRSRKVLEDLLGHGVAIGSVPGGSFSAAVAATAREAGLELLFTSEPTLGVDAARIDTVGRFAIRRGSRDDFAERLLSPSPVARCWAWADWNAKKVAKHLLGPSYTRFADTFTLEHHVR